MRTQTTNRNIVLLLLLQLVTVCGFAQFSRYDLATGSGTQGDYVTFFSNYYTADNGTIIKTQRNNQIIPNFQYQFAKRDSNGVLQWARKWTFNDPLFYYVGSNIIETATGGYYDTYTGGHSIPPFFDYMALRTDGNGNQVWNKSYIAADTNLLISYQPHCRQAADGGYITVGDVVDRNNNDRYCYHAFKTDSTGNTVLWSKLFNADLSKTYHTNMELCANGDVLICGMRGSPNTSIVSCVTRIDGNGNFRWSKRFAYGPYFSAMDVEEAFDGGVVIASQIDSAFTLSVALTKTDSLGQFLWSKRFSNLPVNFFLRGLQRTQDGGYILFGNVSAQVLNNNGFFLKTDANGNFLWLRRFTGKQIESMDETASGGFVCTGTVPYLEREFAIRTNPAGVSRCEQTTLTLVAQPITPVITADSAYIPMQLLVTNGPMVQGTVTVVDTFFCETPLGEITPTTPAFEMYPNPATETVVLKNMPADAQLTVYDASGRIVFTGNSSTSAIPVSNWPTGFYVLQLNDATSRTHYKLLVQH